MRCFPGGIRQCRLDCRVRGACNHPKAGWLKGWGSRVYRFPVIAVLALCLTCAPALALTDEEIFRDFRFNLINPGARSLALGGAFVSLADDATAAQANPAGLTILLRSRQEYFFEIRTVDNRSESRVFNDTVPPGTDTLVATGTELKDRVSLSFVSAVIPAHAVTFGFSRQEVLNSKAETLNRFDVTFPGSPGIFSVEGSGVLDVRVTNYNISAGGSIGHGWSLGASAALSTLSVDGRVENFIVDTVPSLADRPLLRPTLDLRTDIDDTDRDFALTVGALYRRGPFSFGAVYRRAPRFSVEERIGPGIDRDGDGTLEAGLDVFGTRRRFGESFANVFKIPDSYGIGGSWRPNDYLLLAMDLERTEYSDLLEGYVAGVNALTDFDARFRVDDATDVRLGVEYALFPWKEGALLLRAGGRTQADSRIRAVSTGTRSFATKEAFPGEHREYHGSAGLGIVLEDFRYKIDMAVDLAEASNQYLVSFIYTHDRGRP